MPPKKKTAQAGKEVVDLTQEEDVEMQDAAPPVASTSNGTGSKPKVIGEKLFKEDLKLLKAIFGKTDHVVKGCSAGDSDNMFVFKVSNPQNKKRNIVLNGMLIRPDEYGASHQLTVWADDDLDEKYSDALETISDKGSLRIKDAIRLVVSFFAGKEGTAEFDKIYSAQAGVKSPLKKMESLPNLHDEEDDDDYDTMDAHDELFGLGSVSGGNDPAVFKQLRSDFKGIIAAKYRPGYSQLSDGTHVVSISVPIKKLGIESRALHSWDSKLLTPNIRLVLLIAFSRYPITPKEFAAARTTRCVVGLSQKAKPSKAAIASAFRAHSSMTPWTDGELESFALSEPLVTAMKDCFHQVLDFRNYHDGVAWAGSEKYTINTRTGSEIKYIKKNAVQADQEEAELGYNLPKDPLLKESTKNNLPLIIWSYFLRRFIMSPRFCLICHRSLEDVTIKPYVCQDDLCLFQYMSLGFGPSVDYEIVHNSAAVDLLIQLAYSAMMEGLENGFPDSMLPPAAMNIRVPTPNTVWKAGSEEEPMDHLQKKEKFAGIAALINHIPPVAEMKKWLLGADLTFEEQQAAKVRKLTDLKAGLMPESSWKILRWIVASNTSYLREIDEPDMLIHNIPRTYRQFRFITGDPAKETIMRKELEKVQKTDGNAMTYPTLFAFHGSQREGLHYKKTTNGRAYGNSILESADGSISLGSYAQPSSVQWKNTEAPAVRIAALCEIVNSPKEFVSSAPYLVVPKVEWIQTRYLLVNTATAMAGPEEQAAPAAGSVIKLDPKHKLNLHNKPIQIPDIIPSLERVYSRTSNEDSDEEYSPSDREILKEDTVIEIEEDELPEHIPFAPDFVAQIRTLPPPQKSGSAGMHLQREIKSFMKEQQTKGPAALGFYFNPELTNDNMFHWIVELFNFDKDLPIAKDMVKYGVKGVIFEILFPSNFPYAPPFFRVIHPRFLPFTQGGGGHVTGGGSICMDLLTTDGWNSIYTLESILMQIRMAISNLEPRPARLDPQRWNHPYNVQEAVEGFRRAAATHGWQVPSGMESLANGKF